MSKTSFSKGPWKWKIADGYSEVMAILESTDGSQVCNFGNSETYYPTQGEEPSGADMSLIEAAPNLYDALVLARQEMIDSGNWYAHDYGWPKAKLAVDAALAKARGEVSE